MEFEYHWLFLALQSLWVRWPPMRKRAIAGNRTGSIIRDMNVIRDTMVIMINAIRGILRTIITLHMLFINMDIMGVRAIAANPAAGNKLAAISTP